mmetsp:Transcript_43625/g.115251  ORF Transcript_43625/g.115251 Transcript_43625/m.115251 type:complete len:520 (-) Transcript_43625:1580-3139(-)
MPNFDTTGLNFFTSRDFVVTTVRASEIAACTAAIAVSACPIAFCTSSASKTSLPFKYGASASVTRWNARSILSILACDCLTTSSHANRSEFSSVTAFISLSFAWVALAFSKSAWRALCTEPVDDFEEDSMDLVTSVRDACTTFTAEAISLMLSSEGRSSPRGQLNISNLCISSSNFFRASCLSSTTCLLLHVFSPWSTTRRCFPSSACTTFIRFNILTHSAANAAWPALAFCFAVMVFRASAHAKAATFSSSIAFSVAALSVAADASSARSPASGPAASTIARTFVSASTTGSVISCRQAVTFRVWVSFLNSATLVATSSIRANCSFKSVTCFARAPSLTFASSASLCFTNVLPLATAKSTALAASSLSAIAVLASSTGTISNPLRKAPSASVVFSISVSAVAAISTHLTNNSSNLPSSFNSVKRALKSSILFFVTLPTPCASTSFCFNWPCAVAAFWSTNLKAACKLLRTAGVADSATFTSSWVGESVIKCTSLSISTSTTASLPVTWSMTLLVSTFN